MVLGLPKININTNKGRTYLSYIFLIKKKKKTLHKILLSCIAAAI